MSFENVLHRRFSPIFLIRNDRGNQRIRHVLLELQDHPFDVFVKDLYDEETSKKQIYVRYFTSEEFNESNENFKARYCNLLNSIEVADEKLIIERAAECLLNKWLLSELYVFDMPLVHIFFAWCKDDFETFEQFYNNSVSEDVIQIALCVWDMLESDKRDQESYIAQKFPKFKVYWLMGVDDPNFATALEDIINLVVTEHLCPYIRTAIVEGLQKQNTPGNVTLGIASKLFSFGKKYLPNGALLKQNSSSSILNNEEKKLSKDSPLFSLRRLADFCFIFKEYKEALSLYENLMRDFERSSRFVAHYHSAEVWTLFLRLILDTGSKITVKIIDAVFQAYLSSDDLYFDALQLASIFQKSPDCILPTTMFMQFSRVIQSTEINSVFKIHILLSQAHIAASCRKNRLALLLYSRCSDICRINQYMEFCVDFLLRAKGLCHQTGWRVLEDDLNLRIGHVLQKHNRRGDLKLQLLADFINSKTYLSQEEQLFCQDEVTNLAHYTLNPKFLKVGPTFIQQNSKFFDLSLEKSAFRLEDFVLFETYASKLFSQSIILDPIDLFLNNEENIIFEPINLSISIENLTKFSLKLSDWTLHLKDLNGEKSMSLTSKSSITELTGSSSMLVDFDFDCNGIFRFIPFLITCRWENAVINRPIDTTGFRLNFKKEHRMTNSYATNHRMILRKSRDDLVSAMFVNNERLPKYFGEYGIATLQIESIDPEPVEVTMFCLSGCKNSQPSVRIVQRCEMVEIEVAKNASDVVVGILARKGQITSHRLVRRRFDLIEPLKLERFAIWNISGPCLPLLLIKLFNPTGMTCKFESISLFYDAKKISPEGSFKHEIKIHESVFVSFLLPPLNAMKNDNATKIEIWLAGNRRIVIEIDSLSTFLPRSTTRMTLSARSDCQLAGQSAPLVDNPSCQSLWVGDIRTRSECTSDAKIVAGNGSFACLKAPTISQSSQIDIISYI